MIATNTFGLKKPLGLLPVKITLTTFCFAKWELEPRALPEILLKPAFRSMLCSIICGKCFQSLVVQVDYASKLTDYPIVRNKWGKVFFAVVGKNCAKAPMLQFATAFYRSLIGNRGIRKPD